jgi:hypothetical protein
LPSSRNLWQDSLVAVLQERHEPGQVEHRGAGVSGRPRPRVVVRVGQHRARHVGGRRHAQSVVAVGQDLAGEEEGPVHPERTEDVFLHELAVGLAGRALGDEPRQIEVWIGVVVERARRRHQVVDLGELTCHERLQGSVLSLLGGGVDDEVIRHGRGVCQQVMDLQARSPRRVGRKVEVGHVLVHGGGEVDIAFGHLLEQGCRGEHLVHRADAKERGGQDGRVPRRVLAAEPAREGDLAVLDDGDGHARRAQLLALAFNGGDERVEARVGPVAAGAARGGRAAASPGPPRAASAARGAASAARAASAASA